MNTELTELVFILDRSGFTGGLESDTIIKINNMQKHLPENHKAGKVLFVVTADGYKECL